MRRISTLLLTVSLFAIPLSAQAEGSKEPRAASAASKHSKRKTASKPAKGAITVEKLKQEVAGRIAHEREQSERAASKAVGKNSPARKAFEGAVSQVKSRLSGAISDGKITGDELKSVRDSYKLMAVKQAPAASKIKASKSKKPE